MSMSGGMGPKDVLDNVLKVIDQRRENYGDPNDMFAEIGKRWRCARKEVAIQMADLKLARLSYNYDEDSAIDAIAYLVFAVMFADADD